MIIGAQHTSFTVSDMVASLAFYRDLLGMEVTSDREAKGAFPEIVTGLAGAHLLIVYLRVSPGSEHLVELIQYFAPAGIVYPIRTCDPGSAHLAICTENISRDYAEFRAKGVRFRSEPQRVTGGPNLGNTVVYMLDPDGITIELIEQART